MYKMHEETVDLIMGGLDFIYCVVSPGGERHFEVQSNGVWSSLEGWRNVIEVTSPEFEVKIEKDIAGEKGLPQEASTMAAWICDSLNNGASRDDIVNKLSNYGN